MKKTKLISLMLCVVLAASLFAGCSAKPAAPDASTEPAANTEAAGGKDKTLTLVYPNSIATIDPIDGGATMLKEVAGVLETLVNVDSDFNLSPGLATSWERTGDKTWEFKLREGVKFHDGSDFNAETLKWCFDRAIGFSGSFTSYTGIESVEIIDDYTVRFNTDVKTGEVPEGLCNVIGTVYAPSSVGEDGSFVEPVGTGYFKYKSFDVSTGEFVCDVFDDYWAGTQDSSIQTRMVKAIPDSSTRSLAAQNGEVDIITDAPFSDLISLQDNENLDVLQFNTARVYFYTYNLKKDYLSDVNVRRALIYAINKEEIVNSVLLGVGGVPHGIFMDDVSWNNSDVNTYDYDVELAKQLLEEAGFVDSDGDGVREYKGEEVTMQIITAPYRPGNALIVQATQGYFQAIGIDAKVEVLDGNVRTSRFEAGEYDLMLDSAATGYVPSASYFLNQYYHSKSKNAQIAGYSNPELDGLIDQCRDMVNSEEKYEVSRQAQAIAQDDVAVFTVALYGAVFVMDANITGFEYSAAVHDFVVPYSTDKK